MPPFALVLADAAAPALLALAPDALVLADLAAPAFLALLLSGAGARRCWPGARRC